MPRISDYLHLSRKKIFLIWIGLGCVSLAVILLDCVLMAPCPFAVTSSLLAIFLGFLGTLVIAIPSIMTSLGEHEGIIEAKEFNRKMLSAMRRLQDEEELQGVEEEHEAMMTYLHEFTDFDGEEGTISTVQGEGGLSSYIAVNGEDLDVSTMEMAQQMSTYMRRVTADEEWFEEIQERRHVLLGCAIYGQAITFQALATILPNHHLIGIGF